MSILHSGARPSTLARVLQSTFTIKMMDSETRLACRQLKELAEMFCSGCWHLAIINISQIKLARSDSAIHISLAETDEMAQRSN